MDNTIVIPYKPRPLQRELHEQLIRWNLLVCHRRFGKALDVNTPVPMADGSWSTMGELKAGDYVIGSNGKPTKVLMAHDVLYGRECYEVEVASGDVIVADAEHLWSTTRKKDRHNPVRKPDGRINIPRPAEARTTEEIAETLQSRGEFNHRIKTVDEIDYPEQDLPIDPYLLGAWLGNGTARCTEITTMDDEIVQAIDRQCELHGWKRKLVENTKTGKAKTYRINGGFQSLLFKNHLIGNKHIPDAYMIASIKQRKELVGGLMDTDGCINKAGNYCEFVQKREVLALAFVKLLLTLGCEPNVSEKVIDGTTYYRIGFRPNFNCFKVKRKAERFVSPKKEKSQSIVRCDKVKSRPVRCITVDAEDSLYCVGKKFTLTHNTVFAINELVKRACTTQKKMTRFGYVAPYYRQAKQIAWDYLKEFTRPIPNIKINESELRIDFPWEARIQLYGADSPDTMRGLYFDCVVLDEYADMSPRIFSEVIRPALSDREGSAIFIGSAKGGTPFHDLYDRVKNDPGWMVKIYKASETGVIAASELEDAKKIMDDDEYAQEYECSWTASIKGAYYGKQLADAQQDERITSVPYDPRLPVHTAWDLGVGDSTSIWFYQRLGKEIRIIDFYEQSGEGLPHYAKVLQQKEYVYGDHWAPHDIQVRELGSGKSRIETAKMLGIAFKIAPNLSIDDGINAVRNTLPMCWFDQKRCEFGLQALRNYHKEYDDKRKQFKASPCHDWSSHAADAFRYLAVSLKDKPKQTPKTQPKLSML